MERRGVSEKVVHRLMNSMVTLYQHLERGPIQSNSRKYDPRGKRWTEELMREKNAFVTKRVLHIFQSWLWI